MQIKTLVIDIDGALNKTILLNYGKYKIHELTAKINNIRVSL